MKKHINSIVVIAFSLLTFISTPLSAQDDDECAACGWYVDGVKTDKINCYSFDKLTLVLPYNSGMGGYDKINIWVVVLGTNKKLYPMEGVKSIPGSALKTYVKSEHIVFKVFAKDLGDIADLKIHAEGFYSTSPSKITRNQLSTEGKTMKDKKGDPAYDLTMYAYIEAGTITSYDEKYDETGCHCYVKTPNYNYTKLYTKSPAITCTNRIFVGAMDFDPVDLSVPCSVSGTKVDFNNLNKSVNSSNTTNNSNTNSTSINNTPVKAENPVKTSTATGKTVITTVAPTSAAAVKPLDKTKPGYFEEKSEDKKYVYRNGYQKSEGVYHGEVREYDNNQLYKIIIYTEGIEDGLHIIFDDGKVSWTGNYKNGKKDGAWKHYKDGMLEETEKYINGEKQD